MWLSTLAQESKLIFRVIQRRLYDIHFIQQRWTIIHAIQGGWNYYPSYPKRKRELFVLSKKEKRIIHVIQEDKNYYRCYPHISNFAKIIIHVFKQINVIIRIIQRRKTIFKLAKTVIYVIQKSQNDYPCYPKSLKLLSI